MKSLAFVPIYIRLIIAVLLIILAFYLGITSHHLVFKEVRESHAVINKRVFNRVRHPMYLSEMLIYLGLFITTFSLSVLIILILIFLFFNHFASYEEKKLEQNFGKDYIMCKKKVPKWIPFLSRK